MTDDPKPADDSNAPSKNDENATPESAAADGASSPPKKPRIELGPPVFGKYRHFIVVIPFIVYLSGLMIGGYIENIRKSILKHEIHRYEEGDNRLETITYEEALAEQIKKDPEAKFLWVFKLVENSYPYTYMATIGITTLMVLMFGWGYFKVPFRITHWGFIYGIVGFFVWVGLVKLDEMTFQLGSFAPQREAFNPFKELADSKSFMYQFLGVRLFGMILLVPLVEEFFIRGFLTRYVDDPDWDRVPLGVMRFGGLISPTIYGLVAHPMEPLAAIAWFSMITHLFLKTKSIWDCVVAHAITNGLLAWYVIQFEQWHLW